jgi:quinol monooxygenase YgiN
MDLVIFARFHARAGGEDALATTLRAQVAGVRAEPGCLAIRAYRGVRDPRAFWLASRWADEAAFEVHADLPRTIAFLERVRPLIDHELDITRTRAIG